MGATFATYYSSSGSSSGGGSSGSALPPIVPRAILVRVCGGGGPSRFKWTRLLWLALLGELEKGLLATFLLPLSHALVHQMVHKYIHCDKRDRERQSCAPVGVKAAPLIG